MYFKVLPEALSESHLGQDHTSALSFQLDMVQKKTIKTYNARRKVEMRNPECVEVTWRREGNH